MQTYWGLTTLYPNWETYMPSSSSTNIAQKREPPICKKKKILLMSFKYSSHKLRPNLAILGKFFKQTGVADLCP